MTFHDAGRRATRRYRPAGSFSGVVASAHARGELVVQPRMGISDPVKMRAALLATKNAAATTVGTITLDSYTRVGDHYAAREALAAELSLNGYPIVAHGAETTRRMLDSVRDDDFPVQVRHGSALPQQIFKTLIEVGIDASEGGPVSYCLPYGRTPLSESVKNWAQACEEFGQRAGPHIQPHLETFGGCMLGQLCPPSLLVALSVLEGMFFRQHELRSISLSYAQQTDEAQDEEAVLALRRLADEFLPDVDTHIVIYAYMGMYPKTMIGARLLLEAAARLAVQSGAHRLIVKTEAEAHRIPTVHENVDALQIASAAAQSTQRRANADPAEETETYREARDLVETVLDLDEAIGPALLHAFRLGLLDVPYCLHPDNRGASSSYIDNGGRLKWSATGAMPIGHTASAGRSAGTSSGELLGALSYMQRKYDQSATDPRHRLAHPQNRSTGPRLGSRNDPRSRSAH